MYGPIWLTIEQCTAWMNVDDLRVDQRPITFLRILLSRMTEESTENCLLYSRCVLSAGHDIQLVPVKPQQQQLQ